MSAKVRNMMLSVMLLSQPRAKLESRTLCLHDFACLDFPHLALQLFCIVGYVAASTGFVTRMHISSTMGGSVMVSKSDVLERMGYNAK